MTGLSARELERVLLTTVLYAALIAVSLLFPAYEDLTTLGSMAEAKAKFNDDTGLTLAESIARQVMYFEQEAAKRIPRWAEFQAAEPFTKADILDEAKAEIVQRKVMQ